MKMDRISEITIEDKSWEIIRIDDQFGERILVEKDNQEQGIIDTITLRADGGVMHTGIMRGIKTKYFVDIDKAVEHIKEMVSWIEEGAEKGFFVEGETK